MLDKELLEGFETMQQLQDDGLIDSYNYNSKTGDFMVFSGLGKKEVKFQVDMDSMMEFLEEWEKEVEEAFQDKKREEQDREAAYWAIQGVRY